MKTQKSEFIRLTAAARLLGVKNVTVRTWVRSGWINAYWFGPSCVTIMKVSDVARLKRLAVAIEADVAGQNDTRLGSILRESRALFSINLAR